MKKYSLGIDFGTLSARAVIIDTESGSTVGHAVMKYAHGVMSDRLPCGKALPRNFALQHPQDYIDALSYTVREAIRSAEIEPCQIIGVAVDFTSSTILPIDENLQPLCFREKFKSDPHAYVKLWKHHGAKPEAEIINRVAKDMNAKFLGRYGGQISDESMLPKIAETARNSPDVYDAAYRFTEAGDWIVSILTGKETHSACCAGFKALWNLNDGFPSDEFFTRVDPKLKNIVGSKICDRVDGMGCAIGSVCNDAANLCGLEPGTPVAPALIDAHAAMNAAGIADCGSLLMIIGTSTCHILLDDKTLDVEGISGYVEDGIGNGKCIYEAGQIAVGDSFDWFIKHCLPEEYTKAAEAEGLNIHSYLCRLAEQLPPGSNGVIALDWWNGNRAPYSDSSLSGMLYGLTLGTRPEQIYRALIESTAFGAKRIIRLYEDQGIRIDKLCAAGGIASKNPLLMQIYADVIGKEISLCSSAEGSALGSAVYAAFCGGAYSSLSEAVTALGSTDSGIYFPDAKRAEEYLAVYREYLELSEFFAHRKNK